MLLTEHGGNSEGKGEGVALGVCLQCAEHGGGGSSIWWWWCSKWWWWCVVLVDWGGVIYNGYGVVDDVYDKQMMVVSHM